MSAAWAVVASFAAVAATVLGVVLTYRASRAAASAASRKVDLEVFESSLTELRTQIQELKDDLTDEREARAAAEMRSRESEQRALAAEGRARVASRVTTRLLRRVAQLEQALRDAHIDVPAEQPHDLEPDLD